jgi:hypothetical protein
LHQSALWQPSEAGPCPPELPQGLADLVAGPLATVLARPPELPRDLVEPEVAAR